MNITIQLYHSKTSFHCVNVPCPPLNYLLDSMYLSSLTTLQALPEQACTAFIPIAVLQSYMVPSATCIQQRADLGITILAHARLRTFFCKGTASEDLPVQVSTGYLGG